MKTVVEFPDQGVLAEEAAEWLIRLDADTPPSRQELKALSDWLHRSPAHREELEHLAALWGRMNVLTELAVSLANPKNAERSSRTGASAQVRTPWFRHAAVAASLIGALVLGALYLLRGPATDPQTAANGLYATAVGQQTTTLLPDGSQIVLNTNSQIRVDYGEWYRQVHLLQGEALFTVAKDGDRPFRVYAGGGRIQAIGTAFSVYLKGADVQVMVTEGRVALASLEPPRPKAGQSPAIAATRHDGAAPGEAIDDEWAESLGTLSAGQVATIRSPAEETSDGGYRVTRHRQADFAPGAGGAPGVARRHPDVLRRFTRGRRQGSQPLHHRLDRDSGSRHPSDANRRTLSGGRDRGDACGARNQFQRARDPSRPQSCGPHRGRRVTRAGRGAPRQG